MIKAKCNKGCVYHTAYHIVWIPKYRKSILVGKIAKRLEGLIHEIAGKYGF
ncbi:transposase, partial [Desulfurobacterium sp.]